MHSLYPIVHGHFAVFAASTLILHDNAAIVIHFISTRFSLFTFIVLFYCQLGVTVRVCLFAFGSLPLNICRIPSKEMNISNTIVDPFNDLSIIHIYKFQKHVIDNYRAFSKITSANSKITLQNATKGII